jgi:proteasome lid subunit RPN8/RPN11
LDPPFYLLAEAWEALLIHARAALPLEACGLVSGTDAVGMRAHPGLNISPTPEVAFELDAATLLLQLAWEDKETELAAIYHSHPLGPACPTPADIQEPVGADVVHLVADLSDRDRPVVTAWRIVAGQARPVVLICWPGS